MKSLFFVLAIAMSACSSDFPVSSPVSVAYASSKFDGGVFLNRVDAYGDATVVDAPVSCSTCDDNNPCTTDSCEAGQCVHTSKSWDCWPCQSDEDCKIGMKTCQEDGLIHKDGYDFCLSDKTCHTFHQVEECPDDNDPCTADGCSYNDDNDVICEHQAVPNCK